MTPCEAKPFALNHKSRKTLQPGLSTLMKTQQFRINSMKKLDKKTTEKSEIVNTVTEGPKKR